MGHYDYRDTRGWERRKLSPFGNVYFYAHESWIEDDSLGAIGGVMGLLAGTPNYSTTFYSADENISLRIFEGQNKSFRDFQNELQRDIASKVGTQNLEAFYRMRMEIQEADLGNGKRIAAVYYWVGDTHGQGTRYCETAFIHNDIVVCQTKMILPYAKLNAPSKFWQGRTPFEGHNYFFNSVEF